MKLASAAKSMLQLARSAKQHCSHAQLMLTAHDAFQTSAACFLATAAWLYAFMLLPEASHLWCFIVSQLSLVGVHAVIINSTAWLFGRRHSIYGATLMANGPVVGCRAS